MKVKYNQVADGSYRVELHVTEEVAAQLGMTRGRPVRAQFDGSFLKLVREEPGDTPDPGSADDPEFVAAAERSMKRYAGAFRRLA